MLIVLVANDTPENDRSWMTGATLKSLWRMVDWSKHRLIVVDNASCEATHRLYERAHDWFPFEVLFNATNLGTAAAINRGWRLREPGEHCVKMDNDVVVYQAGWADWMEAVFWRDPTIGICGLKRKDLPECPWADRLEYKSTIRLLPHEAGETWIVVERVRHVIGTCCGFSSALIDQIGGLVQPGLYGFDDSLAAVRAKVAGFQSVFLPSIEIEHLDPGGDDYAKWKHVQAARYFQGVNSDVVMYEAGIKNIYHEL